MLEQLYSSEKASIWTILCKYRRLPQVQSLNDVFILGFGIRYIQSTWFLFELDYVF